MTTSEVERPPVTPLPEVVRIVESSALCRWVLAEIVTGSEVSWEATYAPDITGEEWSALRRELPLGATVASVETVGGQLLGIPLAIMALIS